MVEIIFSLQRTCFAVGENVFNLVVSFLVASLIKVLQLDIVPISPVSRCTSAYFRCCTIITFERKLNSSTKSTSLRLVFGLWKVPEICLILCSLETILTAMSKPRYVLICSVNSILFALSVECDGVLSAMEMFCSGYFLKIRVKLTCNKCEQIILNYRN